MAVITGAGSAMALPAWVPVVEFPYPGPVVGGERDIADRHVARTTADGWVLHVDKVNEAINFAPALDGGVTTGEAFGSLSGRSWIDGASDEELTGAFFETGYQIGCGVDVSDGADVQVAGVAGVSPSVGVAPSAEAGVDAGVQAGPSVQVSLPDGSGTVGADAKGDAGAKFGAKVNSEAKADSRFEVAPTVNFSLKPGGVTNVTLAGYDMNLDKKRAAGGFTGAHMQINGCAGPVSIRSYVSLSTVTDTSVDSVAVYGDARRIR
ncbi:hypothetical protein GC425_09820 [Corynebacterium sp. zg254]|uniref:MspA family porin n=2 Tax=Corynebacteriaceae TaxID=1653 RepID=A0ABQ6VHC2_9CORY|nr:MspA family porin [Corynebacterium zhongnanshanii]MCR5915132.1 hypothetical protein [Corynebacterium sp. zg254]